MCSGAVRVAVAVAMTGLAACTSVPRLEAPAEVRRFLHSFATAVESGRWLDAVEHFAPLYVSEQRDHVLEGQTGQFLVEALALARDCAGYAADEQRAYRCLREVCSVQPVAFEPSPGGSSEVVGRVRFAVRHRCGEEPVIAELFLVQSRIARRSDYSLVGPLG